MCYFTLTSIGGQEQPENEGREVWEEDGRAGARGSEVERRGGRKEEERGKGGEEGRREGEKKERGKDRKREAEREELKEEV